MSDNEIAGNTSHEAYQSDPNIQPMGPLRVPADFHEEASKSFGHRFQPFVVSTNNRGSDQGDISLGYQFASPAFMQSRIEASMSSSFLQEATHILSLYH
jgi:hypothetical protein